MNQLPWWAIAIAVVAFAGALQRGRADSVPNATERAATDETLEALWRRYYAIQQILTNQSRRVGEIDATLGVLLVVEVSAFVWYLDKAYTGGHLYTEIIAWSLLLPVLIVGLAAIRRIDESPKAGPFHRGLKRDEAATLREATESMVVDFEANLTWVRAKEAAQAWSVGLFLVAFIVDGILAMLKWR